jgi:hypothetical protein
VGAPIKEGCRIYKRIIDSGVVDGSGKFGGADICGHICPKCEAEEVAEEQYPNDKNHILRKTPPFRQGMKGANGKVDEIINGGRPLGQGDRPHHSKIIFNNNTRRMRRVERSGKTKRNRRRRG